MKKYIFTKNNSWFIDEFESISDAQKAYPSYDVELFVSTSQIYGYFYHWLMQSIIYSVDRN